MEKRMKLHLISNTHWDREWYKSFECYRWRLVKLMDRLLSLLERDPEFLVFTMDGQFLVIKDYLEIRPEKEALVKKLVQEGRLLIGPWYTQPIETLASGEALIRNLMLGIRESKNLGGSLQISYNIDQFSHITQLPQICRGFGIEDVVAWRGIPKGSKAVFKWIGSDSSEMFMFYSNDGYGEATALPVSMADFEDNVDNTSFKRAGLKNKVDALLKLRLPKATTSHLMLLNGIDHSFAQENLPEIIKTINREIPGVNAFHSTLSEYIHSVKEAHQQNNIPYDRYKGELMDSYESPILQDSLSTRVEVKLWNSRVQDLLEKWVEPYAAIAWLLGTPYPKAHIWKAWDYVLQNHAHDSINCSSSDEVFHQVLCRFEWARDIGDEIMKENLQILCNKIVAPYVNADAEKGMVVFNPLNWEREEVITAVVDIPKALGFKNIGISDGESDISMIVHNKTAVSPMRYNPYRGHPTTIPADRYTISFAPGKVPPNGYKFIKIMGRPDAGLPSSSLVKGHSVMENEYLRVSFNANGTINLHDKQSGQSYEKIHFFEDAGEAGDGFNRIPPMNDRIISSLGSQATISVVENSNVQSTFKIDSIMELPVGLSSDRSARSCETVSCRISSLVSLTMGSRRVDITTTIHNKSLYHRLRVIFPTGVHTDHSFAGQPFDVVKRDIALPHWEGDPVEWPIPTHPQQYFVDVSSDKRGITVANKGLYEYEVMDNEDRCIAVTLLRCVGTIYGDGIGSAEEWLMPEAQCLGEHTFQYSIIPHQGTWANSYRDAFEFAFPMQAVLQRELEEEVLPWFESDGGKAVFPEKHAFIEVEPDNLVISAVKKHEENESLVIRILNLHDEETKGRVRVNVPNVNISEAYKVALNEERSERLAIDDAGWVNIHIGIKQLVTIEFIK